MSPPSRVLILPETYTIQSMREKEKYLHSVAENNSNHVLITLSDTPTFHSETKFRICFPVKEVDYIAHCHDSFMILPRTKVLSMTYRGVFEQLEQVRSSFDTYAKENNINFSTPYRVIYRKNEQTLFQKRIPGHLMELQIPLDMEE